MISSRRISSLAPALFALLPSLMAVVPVSLQAGDAKPPVRLTYPEQTFLVPIEKRLATPLNNKANPGDRDTWYVLMFRDVAGVQTFSESRSSSSITRSLATEAAKVDGAMMVQSRREAALTVARFLTKSNTAAQSLTIPVQHSSQKSQAAANKLWKYKAFATEDEARLFMALIAPKKSTDTK